MPNTPSSSSKTPVIVLENAHLSLGSDAASVHILKGISLHIDAGESVGILGPSGAGKTSLLMILAGLETLSNGRISLDGTDITGLDEDRLAALRRDLVGIVFQAFRLIPSLTALQNVAIPLELAGRDDADDMAKAALQSVGLTHRLSHLPAKCLAASNSVWPLLGPWLPSRGSCLPTNRPATLIVSLAKKSSKTCFKVQQMPMPRWFW